MMMVFSWSLILWREQGVLPVLGCRTNGLHASYEAGRIRPSVEDMVERALILVGVDLTLALQPHCYDVLCFHSPGKRGASVDDELGWLNDCVVSIGRCSAFGCRLASLLFRTIKRSLGLGLLAYTCCMAGGSVRALILIWTLHMLRLICCRCCRLCSEAIRP